LFGLNLDDQDIGNGDSKGQFNHIDNGLNHNS